MTKLIYLEMPECLECNVQVLKCDLRPDGAEVILDQTPFYPEGGGQPSDTGRIGDAVVRQVLTDDDCVVRHLVDKPVPLGTVKASVDPQRRLDHMQQHAAQHLLSACLLELADARTVGFHMSETYTSIDLDQKVDQDVLNRAVLMANDAIRAALPIEIFYPDDATLQNLPLRKMPKVEDKIRVVRIGDLDYSPCGGTHPDNTAGIGCVMVTRFENYKSGTRVEFLAGDRAIKDMLRKNAALTQLSQRLATPVADIVSGVDKLLALQSKLEKELRQARTALLEFEAIAFAEELRTAEHQTLIKVLQDQEMSELRTLVASALKEVPTGVVITANVSGDNTQVQLLCARGDARASLDMRDVFKPAIAILEGRGGGNPAAAQGGGPRADRLGDALEAAKAALEAQLAPV